MNPFRLLPRLGLLLAVSLSPTWLYAEETTQQIVEIADRLSQRVPSPVFEASRVFQTPERRGGYLDVSVDGSRMVLMQRDKKFSTWNIDEGKKLADFTAKNSAIDGVLKISRDGKWTAFANQRKFIEVYEVETGKLVHTFDQMDWNIGDIGFSLDSQLLYAVGTKRQLLIAKPEGDVIKHESEPILERERHVRMCNFGQDRWATVIERKDTDIVELIWESPDGTGREELPYRNPPNIVGGPLMFCVFSGAEIWFGPTNLGGIFHSPTQQFLTDVRIDSIENPERANYVWISTWSGAELRGSWRMDRPGQITVPRRYDPHVMLVTAPNSQRMIEHSPSGRAVVHELREAEIRPSAYRTANVLDQVMREKRYDVIRELGKRWANRPTPINDNKIITAYSELVHHVREYRDVPRNAEQQAQWLAELVEMHPDNDVFRLALASQYFSIGTEARGSGYADKVSPEAWQTLAKYMQESWETIEPMLEKENVPPEVYVQVVFLARYQQWDRERLEPYLERAMKEAPSYHRIWSQECTSRLPRWGGSPGETEALAAKVADQIGGKDGDILYAEVARLISIYFQWKGLFEEAGFDQERVMRGMVAICEREPDTYAENQALQLALEINDHAAGQKIATLWQERNHTYIHRLWKWDLKKVQDTMAWALADAPEEEKTAPDPKPEAEEDEAAEVDASPKTALDE